MLCHLQIKNIGIIESLNLDFESGLNVLTGETGAGKSIIVSACHLLLGSRVKPAECLKSDVEHGSVRGVFFIPETHPALSLLREAKIPGEDQEILIVRELYRNGRSKCLVNDALVNLNLLKQLGKCLIDVHGTFDHQTLLQTDSHLNYLDRFAECSSDLTVYQGIYQQWVARQKDLESAQKVQKNLLEKQDLLHFQLSELSFLKDLPDSLKELEEEHARLNDAATWLERVNEALSIALEGNSNLLSGLRRFESLVDEMSQVESKLEEPDREIETFMVALIDCCDSLRTFRDKLVAEPGRLETLERLFTDIRRLSRKYNQDYTELRCTYQELQDHLQAIETPPDFEALGSEVESLEAEVLAYAKKMTEKRQQSAELLQKKIKNELKDLGMTHAALKVSFKSGEPGLRGVDDIEFLLLSNPGQPFLPLIQIASGGELCRIMLAFKTVFAAIDEIPVLVFDEIDANIGGVTAVAAAEKMQNIAKNRQVITVTHQVPIASKAAKHFAVVKKQTSQKTETAVHPLQLDERVDEIARMLGGSRITSVVMEHAREMLVAEGVQT